MCFVSEALKNHIKGITWKSKPPRVIVLEAGRKEEQAQSVTVLETRRKEEQAQSVTVFEARKEDEQSLTSERVLEAGEKGAATKHYSFMSKGKYEQLFTNWCIVAEKSERYKGKLGAIKLKYATHIDKDISRKTDEKETVLKI